MHVLMFTIDFHIDFHMILLDIVTVFLVCHSLLLEKKVLICLQTQQSLYQSSSL
eukprot:m.107177 g.107177  ORF g.107177 m.107177 type:complete len:54 (+) comp13916_c1_seq3:1710-1871(+)